MKALAMALVSLFSLSAVAAPSQYDIESKGLEGSISREDAQKEVCEESSNLCPVFELVKLDPTGSAVRSHDGVRTMPYVFPAEVNDMRTAVRIRRDEKGHIVVELR